MLLIKRIFFAITILTLLSVFHGMLPSNGYAESPDTFVFMDEPIPPYTLGKEGEICKKGITKDIFDELFGRLNIHYEIRLVPWARALDSALHGKCDGIPLLMKNKEREAFLKYTIPVVNNREMLFFLPERLGEFQWEEFGDLKDYHIGLVRGYAYGDAFTEAIAKYNIKITYAKDSQMNFNMLQAKRVDFVIEDEIIARQILDKHPAWSKTTMTAPKPVSSYTWHIGLSIHSPLVSRIDDINSVLNDMHKDGSLEEILSKR